MGYLFTNEYEEMKISAPDSDLDMPSPEPFDESFFEEAIEDLIRSDDEPQSDGTDTTDPLTDDTPVPAEPQYPPIAHPDDDEDILTGDSYHTLSGSNRLSRFIITFFPKQASPAYLAPETYFKDAEQLFNSWGGQFEICPSTGRLHAHIYVEAKRNTNVRFNRIMNVFRGFFAVVNIKNARRASIKQRKSAINYCFDPRKRAPGTTEYCWAPSVIRMAYDPSAAKKTKDDEDESEKQRLWIESKPRCFTWDQIVHECEDSKKLLFNCSWGPKYHAGRHAEIPRKDITHVVLMYGAGGTGKTTLAKAWDVQENELTEERYYRRNPDDGHFWGGGHTAYNGQRILHFEEFTGSEPLSRLKEVCDIGKQGPSVNIKRGGAVLNHDTVLFTSNVHPADWYGNLWGQDPKQFHPFWRRVTCVMFFPEKRPDGSLNTPDEENPPYFIDQTEDWRAMGGDYEKCLESAARHWPTKTPEDPRAMLFNPGRNDNVQHHYHQYALTGKDPTRA